MMTKNPLEDMRVFREVIDAGSFTAAAERLDTSKQLVSKRLMALEERLGVRLLNRTTRRLSPTPLGLAYLERAREILQTVEDAENTICQQAALPRGLLRISAPMSFGTRHLAPLLPDFLRQYPDVDLALDLSDRMVDLIAEGFDVAVRIGLLADSSLVARRIAAVRMVTCASPGYFAEAGMPLAPGDLAGHRCLIYGSSLRGSWNYAGMHGGEARIDVSGRMCSNNGDALCDAAEHGLGIVHLPDFLVDDALAEARLVRTLEAHEAAPIPLCAVYPRHRQTSLLVRAFVDFMLERFRDDVRQNRRES